VNIEIVDLLDRYANAVIYPLTALENLVKRDYQTAEQYRFEEQLKISHSSLLIAGIGCIVASLSLFITCFGYIVGLSILLVILVIVALVYHNP